MYIVVFRGLWMRHNMYENLKVSNLLFCRCNYDYRLNVDTMCCEYRSYSTKDFEKSHN